MCFKLFSSRFATMKLNRRWFSSSLKWATKYQIVSSLLRQMCEASAEQRVILEKSASVHNNWRAQIVIQFSSLEIVFVFFSSFVCWCFLSYPELEAVVNRIIFYELIPFYDRSEDVCDLPLPSSSRTGAKNNNHKKSLNISSRVDVNFVHGVMITKCLDDFMIITRS